MDFRTRDVSLKNPGSLLLLAMLAVTSLIGVVLFVPIGPAAASSTFPTMNDSGGIYWRSAPNWNDSVAQSGNGFYPGTYVSVSCYESGTTVPGSADTMWVQASWVSGPGHGSGWMNEHYVNDNAAINHAAADVPPCDGSSSTSSPTSTSPPTSTSNQTSGGPPSQLIAGTVVCDSGRSVAGVWVQSSAGASHFASWKAEAWLNVAQYHAYVSPGGTISIHVGCGRHGAVDWTSDNWTAAVAVGSAARVINVLCSDGTSTGSGIRCAIPTQGRTETWGNPGQAGNCTWEASKLMYDAIGAYPGWGGNALVWATNASRTGWTVSQFPMVNSIFVSQPGYGTPSSEGHVGWVTNVSSDGRSFSATEMNVSGLYSLYRGRSHDLNSTMRFVLIPPSPPVG